MFDVSGIYALGEAEKSPIIILKKKRFNKTLRSYKPNYELKLAVLIIRNVNLSIKQCNYTCNNLRELFLACSYSLVPQILNYNVSKKVI